MHNDSKMHRSSSYNSSSSCYNVSAQSFSFLFKYFPLYPSTFQLAFSPRAYWLFLCELCICLLQVQLNFLLYNIFVVKISEKLNYKRYIPIVQIFKFIDIPPTSLETWIIYLNSKSSPQQQAIQCNAENKVSSVLHSDNENLSVSLLHITYLYAYNFLILLQNLHDKIFIYAENIQPRISATAVCLVGLIYPTKY